MCNYSKIIYIEHGLFPTEKYYTGKIPFPLQSVKTICSDLRESGRNYKFRFSPNTQCYNPDRHFTDEHIILMTPNYCIY